MKISRNWLEDYIDLSSVSNERLEEILTTRVAEVEDMQVVCPALGQAVVVDCLSFKEHPQKENLTLVTVSDGKKELEIVCGDKNCVNQSKAVLVGLGASVFQGGNIDKKIQIEEREVAGVLSKGVLVSEAELGLTDDHSGLMQPGDYPAGTRLSDIFGESDVVFEIDNKSLTHRPDLWSHFGFARELSAILDRKLITNCDLWADIPANKKSPLLKLKKSPASLSIHLDNQTGSNRFCALEISNVVDGKSPFKIRRRLRAIGAGVKSTLIDISNYVLNDVGQPNHVYDKQRLNGGELQVRFANEGEEFVGLDEQKRKLSSEDVVIADEVGPVALAGVIGGLESSVNSETSTIVLEAAHFDPVRVRQTTKRHSLRTDSSNRFEKSQSEYLVGLGLERFIQLLKESCPDIKIVGGLADEFKTAPEQLSINSSFEFIKNKLGADIPDSEISRILTSLGFNLSSKKGAFDASVPYYRATRDISIPEDLVEEIGRIYGYENIPQSAPKIESTASEVDSVREAEHLLRDALRSKGCSECYSYSFMNSAKASELGYDIENTIELRNTVSGELNKMRTSLIPGMLDAISLNAKNYPAFSLFELGRTYEERPSGKSTESQFKSPSYERRMLCLGSLGPKKDKSLSKSLSPALDSGHGLYAHLDVLKEIVREVFGEELLVEQISDSGETSNSAGNFKALKNWMHPFRAGSLSLNGTIVGHIAEVSPVFSSDIGGRVVLSEVDVGLLTDAKTGIKHFESIPKFPDSFFEVSVVMDEREKFSELKEVILDSFDKSLFRKMDLISVYRGQPLEEGQTSLSVKLYLGASSHTLSSDELSQIQDAVVGAVNGGGYSLRS